MWKNADSIRRKWGGTLAVLVDMHDNECATPIAQCCPMATVAPTVIAENELKAICGAKGSNNTMQNESKQHKRLYMSVYSCACVCACVWWCVLQETVIAGTARGATAATAGEWERENHRTCKCECMVRQPFCVSVCVRAFKKLKENGCNNLPLCIRCRPGRQWVAPRHLDIAAGRSSSSCGSVRCNWETAYANANDSSLDFLQAI